MKLTLLLLYYGLFEWIEIDPILVANVLVNAMNDFIFVFV